MKPKVLVIVGPTASGKSDLALRLAKSFNGEVISADSRQVYKGLNVGTGKITKLEMRGVPHHLLDVADPRKQFTVSEYKKRALEAIKKTLSKGRLPIVVGGTGFYIDSLTMNLPEVEPNPYLRLRLNMRSAETLYEMLKKKDPRRAKEIDPHNKLRLIRALEIIAAMGRVPKLKAEKLPYQFVFIGLKPDDLEERIHSRLLERMPSMIKEAKNLHKKGLSWKRMEELGLEYRYLARLLQKKITQKEFADELYSEIKKYSKRQMTWFKKNEEILWIKPGSSFGDTSRILQAQLTRGR